MAYEEIQTETEFEWLEGTARYSEYMSSTASKSTIRKNLDHIKNKMNEGGDERFYALGMAQALVLDKLDSDSDINEAYQKLSEVVETTANDALNSDEDQTYSNIEDLRMMGKEIGIIKDLGKKHNYRIPFVIDGEVGTIHLQVVEDDKNKGRIAVRLETKELGNVSIEGKLSSQNASVFAVTDGDKNILSDRINKVTDEISADLEVENVSIYAGKSDEIPEVNYKTDSREISTKKLYQFAKILITAMIKPEQS
jgi:hypothetical protein